MHGWIVGSDVASGQNVPFYLLPSLGGGNTLRSFADFRFHDRTSLLFSAESRVHLTPHLDGALFVDAGSVARHVDDLDLARRSYGGGLRLHTSRATLARVDVAHGSDGWRFLFRVNDPMRLGRVRQHGAAIPVVP